MKLTDKQRRFSDEYLIDLNATQAAIRAGYSAKTAEWIGPQLLTKPHVAAAVLEMKQNREARTSITQDRVLREISRIAFGDTRRVMSWGPDGVRLIDSATLTDDEAAMVSEASASTSVNGGSIKLKLNDRMKALELLGRHLALFTDNHAVAVSLTEGDRTEKAIKLQFLEEKMRPLKESP
jgi:phage terminase small subunit